MSPESDLGMNVTERAVEWFGILLEGNEQRAEFFAWLDESPRHVEEFLFVLADAQDLASLDSEQRMRIENLSRELGTSASPASNVVPVSQAAVRFWEGEAARESFAPKAIQPLRARRRLAPWSGGALAATLLIAMGTFWWFTGPGAWTVYTTAVGDQREVTLPDGSLMHLNTDSEVAVRFGKTGRNLRLVKGEALFDVQHDVQRPFLVQSADTVIKAVGTSFDVYRHESGTRVAVIEGVVQISDPRSGAKKVSAAAQREVGSEQLLAAGQAVEVSARGEVSPRKKIDTTQAAAWRQRRLVFEGDSLGDIIAEFNRYNTKNRMRAVGGVAGSRHFSGTFDAIAPESLVAALESDPTLIVERVGDEIVIREQERDELGQGARDSAGNY
jgi:transmembrane sensor